MATSKKSKNTLQAPDSGIVIQNITIRPAVRQSQNIERWRNAIQAAEALNPIRVPLLDLYEELMLDAVLSSLAEKRVLGVTKSKLQFVDKDGKEIDGMTDLINRRQFRELRKEIARAKIWGPTVIELMRDPVKDFKLYSVPRKHIRPKEGRIVYEQYGTDGIDYRQPPASRYILEVGHWNDLGLLMKAAPYVIYKRGGFGDWAQYAEIFGMPFREGRYNGYDEKARMQLEQALEQAGSAAYAVLPEGAQITFHESKSTQGSSQLYNDLRKACNEEMSILFLGQTETTAKTQGKLGGSDATHEQTEDDINNNDKADELSILNEDVIPILATLGYPVAGGRFVYEKQEADIPLKDRIDNVIRLRKEAGLPIDDDFIYEMAGVPKPANYDQLKDEERQWQEQAKEQFQKDPKEPAGEDPKKDASKKGKGNEAKKLALIQEFQEHLDSFFGEAPNA